MPALLSITIKMSQGSLESLLGSSSGQAELLDSQGSILRKKEETKRIQRRIGTFKGNFTTETKKFIGLVEHFENKYPPDDNTDLIGSKLIDYAAGILSSFNRVIDRYVALENTLDEWKTLLTDIWEGSEEELVTAISKQDEGFQKYDKDYVDMTRKYDTTIERCKDISIKASQGQKVIETAPPSTTDSRTTGVRPQLGFRPQADLKPIFLNKDCNLIEFTEFTKAYVLYMKSSGTAIPRDAVCSHLRVHVDAWWQHYIEHVGLTIHSDISHFIKIMDITARNKFPIHARRMKCFTHAQKGDTMS